MQFRLTKHHGLGNDFLVVLTDDPALAADREAWVARAPRWCDRRRGVGADGLLVGLTGPHARYAASGEAVDIVMTLVNADGSVAEMSGNGIRCLAQAAVLAGLGDSGALVVATDAGVRTVEHRPSPDGDPATLVASVDMGPAGPGPEPDHDVELSATDVPPASAAALGLDARRSATFDLGNPHLVLLVDDPDAVDLVAGGSTHEAAFVHGMNVHFVAPAAGEVDAVVMRVWERGAGVTEACGTGATAVARAVHDWGLTGPRVTVHMPGGDVIVDVGPTMTLHGPATFIARVEIDE
jgi:diaminopimelate epimerase